MSDFDLVIGMTSYVDISEADDFVMAHFVSDDVQRVAWEELEEDDKAVHLRNALNAIEGVRWVGEKCDATQLLSFPRQKSGTYRDDYFSYGYAQSVAKDVKAAQIEEAVERACPSEASERKKRLNDGLVSSQIGHLRETFTIDFGEGGHRLATIFQSLRAQELMQKYIGSFEVR